MRTKRPVETSVSLREIKKTRPVLRERGLEEYRFNLEYDKIEPMSTMDKFVKVHITDEAKIEKFQAAIKARDIATIKNIFLEIAKKQPQTVGTVDKINNIILGDSPPWEYLDYFFCGNEDSPLFRTP